MNRAAELLDVIESSHLSLGEGVAGRRQEILKRLSGLLQDSGTDDEKISTVTEYLQSEGIVLGDIADTLEVVSEYVQVVTDESSTLGDDEMNFLNSFLK